METGTAREAGDVKRQNVAEALALLLKKLDDTEPEIDNLRRELREKTKGLAKHGDGLD
ncbi:MAG TPA: hypothetical protein VGY55_11785 [Pirellulales bacterium]|jgi:hypothetical protein|nr:hypothetical protein [Pirellulales bacterium]